jgi:hypothetical protein
MGFVVTAAEVKSFGVKGNSCGYARECQRKACFILTTIFSSDSFQKHFYTKLENADHSSNVP